MLKIFRMNGIIYPKVFGLFLPFLWEDFLFGKENGGECIYEIYPRYLLSTVDTTVSRLC